MADHIKIRRAGGTWVVRAKGAVIGESSDAFELVEGGYPPVIYFPRGDLAMALLDMSASTTTCPHKGDATYFSLEAKSGTLKDAAWSYETPKSGVDDIRDHIAFRADLVTVEKL